MVEKSINAGVVMLGRPQFDIALAQKHYQEALKNLNQQGINTFAVEEPITFAEEINIALTKIGDLHNLQAMVVFQGTFADASMILTLRENIDLPMVIWAVKEQPTGERLRLNSLCGLNLAANALVAGKKQFKAVYGDIAAPATIREVVAFLRAAAAKVWLKGKKIGIIGNRPGGFYASNFNEVDLYSKFGIKIDYISLNKVFNMATRIDARQVKEKIESLDGLSSRSPEEVNKSLQAYQALKEIIREHRYDAVAIECWPAFMTEFGGAACYAVSQLNDDGISTACEADVNGAITMLLGQFLSGQPVFFADLVIGDDKENTLTFWHCGAAPRLLAANNFSPIAGVHPNRKMALSVNFPLKEGEVTITRLSPGPNGQLRLLVTKGTGLQTQLLFQGNTLPVKLAQPVAQVIDKFLQKGLEHHYAIIYGNYILELKELGKLLGLEIIE
ncbi:L-fucose/L-arabinose isomerase family protein [Neomoorella thermoacetica]|uniref:L-fucose/L-arabinose isomerase family protein n=1 Tax=Neomoorella thermoacetica TaxID=1525 RepID=UPI0030D139B8